MKVTPDETALCPISRALACVGDSWTLLILREALQGATRFDQFQRDLGIASSMLTRRLERMTANGLLQRQRYQARPPRFEYRLTEKGRDLGPVLITLYQWGEDHLPIAACGLRLVDRDSRQPIAPVLFDRGRQAPLALERIELEPGPDATPAIHARAERLRAARTLASTSPDSPTVDTAEEASCEVASGDREGEDC
ncbi:winged helix-turn-helix transcriptional regulator [Salinicola avicenniae]|uniref:winged helix-turn-helix transcriptional regulator n=1 Tax=Salinicola avicenniae TaxID=2916836 RepID=UPI0020741069|nr:MULTISPECIES: helix-turn-helix domain-containing protein [unclassified Salinicola]